MLIVEYAVQEIHHPGKHFHAQYQQKKHQERYEICSKLTTKTSQQRRSGVFFVNFDHISLLFLVFLLLTLDMDLFTGMVEVTQYLYWIETRDGVISSWLKGDQSRTCTDGTAKIVEFH